MRRFILYSRIGYTGPFKGSLLDAGRLDTVYQCILTSLFVSHGIRRDVEFHAFLYGKPNPPLHLIVDGRTLHDIRIDENTWKETLNKVLSGGAHPGVSICKEGIEVYAKSLNEYYILNEKGEDIKNVNFKDPSFFVGDHVGLPKKFEDALLKNGAKKISIGNERYLAASTIDITNYILDEKGII